MRLYEVISSIRLFRDEAILGFQTYHSQRHKIHQFEVGEVGLYGAAYFKIFQMTLTIN